MQLDAPPPGLPTKVELSAVSITLPRWLDGRRVWISSHGLVGLCAVLSLLRLGREVPLGLMVVLGGAGWWIFAVAWGTILALVVRLTGLRSVGIDTERPGGLFWILFGPAVFGVLLLFPLLVDAALGLGLADMPPLPGLLGALGLLALYLALAVGPAIRQHRLRLDGAYLTLTGWRTQRWPLESLRISLGRGLLLDDQLLPSSEALTDEERRWLADVLQEACMRRRAMLEAGGHDLRTPARPPAEILALRDSS